MLVNNLERAADSGNFSENHFAIAEKDGINLLDHRLVVFHSAKATFNENYNLSKGFQG